MTYITIIYTLKTSSLARKGLLLSFAWRTKHHQLETQI